MRARLRKSGTHGDRPFDLDVDFVAEPGFTILFGASGAGKTTILDCIAGIRAANAGAITLGSSILYDSAGKVDVPAWKRRIGYVIQELALFPHLSARRNIEYGLQSLSVHDRRARSAEIMKALRIEPLGDANVSKLSGGERQRVALARALVIEPVALLLDEPLAALDRPTKATIIDDLREWNRSHNVPILYVTHSSEEVFALGEQVLMLEEGRIVARGTPHEVMLAPRLETVAQLSGFENIFPVEIVSLHEDRGTMRCRLRNSSVELETPLMRVEARSVLRVGVRAGDLLLATEPPRGLSARNVLPGTIRRLDQRDVVVAAVVDCGGIPFEVHLTLAARESLGLTIEKPVWLIVKTHSCHLMR